MPFDEMSPPQAPFTADLSVIDIAAWLRVREEDWVNELINTIDESFDEGEM